MNPLVARLWCVVVAGVLFITRANAAVADVPPLWGKLPAGPHAVGFKSLWQLDYARRYNMTFDDKTTYAAGKAPRPILINIWYPAKATPGAKPMPHRGYLEIGTDDPRLTKFANKLVEYDQGVIAKELIGKAIKELTEPERMLLKEFLDTPTACVRDAPSVEGRFPLVIYHSGNGSSFEDNAVLCEFLASHGYVVFGGAFQESSGKSFNVENSSTRDFEYLVGFAKQQANVDWNHIGVVGHSAGAHAALTYRAQPHCAADAIISLDTTEDYYHVGDMRWEPMTTTIAKNNKNMVGPILMCANPHAYFELADGLAAARRYYFTIKDLGHNDFIAQGRIGRELRNRLRSASPPSSDKDAAEAAAEKAELEAVKPAYEALCIYVLHFLDAELKGDTAAKQFIAKQYRDTKLAGTAPHVLWVPEGVTKPDAYAESSGQPPTPRQFRYYFREHGAEKTVALLRRFRKETPDEPIFHHVFAFALIGELLDKGQTTAAVAFNDFYRELDADVGKVLTGWAEAYVRLDRKGWARENCRKALLLDPTNAKAAALLKELEAAEKK